MLKRVVPRRVLVLGAVLLGLSGSLAACVGEDLAKANFERTTIRAEPGAGRGAVPEGPIDDPAVELSALRPVDACALLAGPAVADLEGAGEPVEVEWGVCRRDMLDAGGKPVELWLDLGESNVLADQATGNVAGLPLTQQTIDETTCFATAVTSRKTGLGISVSAEYPEGGDTCGVATTVLREVIRVLRDTPPRYPVEPGSLLETDPCANVAEDVLSAVFGDERTTRPMGLHMCMFGADRATLHLRFRLGYPLGSPPERGEKVTIGDGIIAVREAGGGDTAECDVTWQHRAIAEDASELVSVSYYDYSETADTAQACEKATQLAESVVTTLPSA